MRPVPIGCQQAKDHLICEVAVDPCRVTQPSFLYKPGKGSRSYHRRIVGDGLDLLSMEAKDLEAVIAQDVDNVGGQPSAAEAGTQRYADVGRSIVVVDSP